LLLRLASSHPELLDGIALSATSTKVHLPRLTLALKDVTLWPFKPRRQVSLAPYIRYGISDDPRIADERLSDPLSRNRLSAAEIMKFGWMSRRTIDVVDKIPPTLPILILQGSKDKLYKPAGIKLLAAHLQATDKQVHWLTERGHILLETQYLRPETMDILLPWLDAHIKPTSKNLAVEQSS